MRVSVYTRVLLNLIIAIFFSPKLICRVSSSSLVDDTTDHPQTRHQKHSVERLLGDSFTLARYVIRPKHATGSVAGLLRIPGQTHAWDPSVEEHLAKYNRLPDVSVNCSSSGFVLTVKRTFYGFSAIPEELTLGETCKSNGVLEPHNDLLFIYALTDCQSEKQVSFLYRETFDLLFPHLIRMTDLNSI